MKLERRLLALEQRATQPRLVRFFVLRPGLEPQGFHARPDGPAIARRPGEDIPALQRRCCDTAPEVFAWTPFADIASA